MNITLPITFDRDALLAALGITQATPVAQPPAAPAPPVTAQPQPASNLPVIPGVHVLALAWPAEGSIRIYTKSFGSGETTIFVVDVPENAKVGPSIGRFNGGYNTTQEPNRVACLSVTPNVFSAADSVAPGTFIRSSTTIQVSFSVGVASALGAYGAVLMPGHRYYLNVKNLNLPVGGDGNMYMDLYLPT